MQIVSFYLTYDRERELGGKGYTSLRAHLPKLKPKFIKLLIGGNVTKLSSLTTFNPLIRMD